VIANSTLTQDEASALNSIINNINNPRLLGDDKTTGNEGTNLSPSNSPAKNKSKTSTTSTKDADGTHQSYGAKKSSKKQSKSSERTPLALKPGKYLNHPSVESAAKPTPPHDHNYKRS